MEESSIGLLISNQETSGIKPNNEIKRRRKIQYRKTRGRLNQKTSGVLNKSICKKNIQLNESLCHQNQLVAVRDVNSFLSKNRELARALEESRSQAKEYEKAKLVYQSECIGMREKLNIYQNAVLKCSCNKKSDGVIYTSDVEMLINMEDTMKQSLSYLHDYMTSLSMQLVEKEDGGGFHDQTVFDIKSKYRQKSTLVSVSTQTDGITLKNVRVQCEPIATRNKKLQVRIEKFESNSLSASEQHKNIEIEDCKEYDHKETQCSLNFQSVQHRGVQCSLNFQSVQHRGVQCSLVSDSSPILDDDSMKEKQGVKKIRKPLAVLQTKNHYGSPCAPTNRPLSILKKKVSKEETKSLSTATSLPFQIFEDIIHHNKENDNHFLLIRNRRQPVKKVTIHSPATVHTFDKTLEEVEESRLRQRKKYPDYKEPLLNRKLTKLDPTVDTKFYASPYQRTGNKSRKRKLKRNKNKANITLEEIISIVEESFLSTRSK